MTSLEPGQLWLMRIHALIAAVVIAVPAMIAETVFVSDIGLPHGLIGGPALLLIFYMIFISPGKHYRAWGYAMDGEELRIRHGVWTQTETIVPLVRVQHIDVSQGPIERPLAVCRLIVHTAGTQHSRVTLPGLSRADAERMRDEIRARIRQEPE